MSESFLGLLRAEWTKLRTVGRWVVTLIAAAALTIGLSYLAASSNKTDYNAYTEVVSGPHGEPVSDEFYYVHQQVTGDTTLTVQVATLTEPDAAQPGRGPESNGRTRLDDPSPFARPAAGIMIKDGLDSGASYAAVLLTSGHGVHLQADFDIDHQGSTSSGTRWLRLERKGNTITGYESADGTAWQKIGTATPKNLPSTAEIGFYVSSPAAMYTFRGGGISAVGMQPTRAEATFDNVQFGSGGSWQDTPIFKPGRHDPSTEALGEKGQVPDRGRMTVRNGAYTVIGTGKIGPQPPDDDMVEVALIGVIAGLMALIAVGVLYATAEYRRGMIRTTFAAIPRRGRVLAAKAIVLGGVCFLVGLVGAAGSFVLAIPALRKNGFTTPAFPEPSLWDGTVLRALLLTAAFMAGVAIVGMAIGVLLRHSAAAITSTVLLVVAPLIISLILPGTAPKWLMYTTLAGGLATQRAKPPTITLAQPWAMIGPWAGIGVVAAWVAVTLGLAWWQLRKRDA